MVIIYSLDPTYPLSSLSPFLAQQLTKWTQHVETLLPNSEAHASGTLHKCLHRLSDKLCTYLPTRFPSQIPDKISTHHALSTFQRDTLTLRVCPSPFCIPNYYRGGYLNDRAKKGRAERDVG